MSGDGARVADVVQCAIAKSHARLLANEPGVWKGDDDEAVHQARVATRRLRADLRTFEPFLDAQWANELRAELRWVAADLGAVRDLDVLRARLHEHAGRLPAEHADAARRALRRLDADREAARTHLLASMRQARYAQLRASLDGAAAAPRLTRAARKRATRALPPRVRRRWKKLRRAVHALDERPRAEELHGIRIQAKKARYAAEACTPVFGRAARQFAARMAELQDVLGEHHDACVAHDWLAKTADQCTETEAFALGMLARLEAEAAEHAAAQFPPAWLRARRPRIRRWLA